MKKLRFGLLPRVICAILLGLVLGSVMPAGIVGVFATFNSLFSQFLGFIIPLIILGMVVPGIADLGRRAGSLLLITVGLAYASTLFSGFFTYFSCKAVFPAIIGTGGGAAVVNPESTLAAPFFTIDIDPVFGVMTALVLAFMLGIGIAATGATTLRNAFSEFKAILEKVIVKVIIPLLPFYIFGIFLNMSHSGEAMHIIALFGKMIGVIFVLHILLLLIQFSVAGGIAGKNPLRMLVKMMPAYATALGTSSSAATIPVTLGCVRKLGVEESIAEFTVPLCATIHLAGSVMKITATALGICMMYGMPYDTALFTGFIFMLSVMMVAAPGVPGGAIMAAVGVLQSMLGFDQAAIGLMIALYISIDSFGTACNVTGDGAIAVIVDRINR